jgi:hypothetical protein
MTQFRWIQGLVIPWNMIFTSDASVNIMFHGLNNPCIHLIESHQLYIIQIYHVWEGYLWKISVEKRKISRAKWRGKFSLNSGIFRKYPSQTWHTPNIIYIITPYIRMLSSAWLMKGVYFYQFLVFSAFLPLPGYLPNNYPSPRRL